MNLLGRGGMGEVYRAHDEVMKELLALKTLAPHIAADREAANRIKGEVQLARRVSHPNVCRIFDIGMDTSPGDPVTFLTMEILEGETLRDRLTRQPITGDDLPAVVLQMANALAAVHQGGVVHRDFKPENVMLVARAEGAPPRVVVMDFGLARPSTSGRPPAGSDAPGSVASGTPAYMAPELRGGGAAGPLSDVYAFGMVLLEMLCGPVSSTNAGSRASCATGPVSSPQDRLRSSKRVTRGRDDWLWTSLASRCLAPDPDERIPSFAAIVHELQRNKSSVMPPLRQGSRRTALVVAVGSAVLIGAVLARDVPGRDARDSRLGAGQVRTPNSDPRPRTFENVSAKLAIAPPVVDSSRQKAEAKGRVGVTSRARTAARRNGHTPRSFGSDSAPRLAPDNSASVPIAAPLPIGTIEERLGVAEKVLLDGDVSAACSLGERLRADAVESPEVHRFLGKCYMRAGRPLDGRVSYQRYLRLAPAAEDAPFVRGIVGRAP